MAEIMEEILNEDSEVQKITLINEENDKKIYRPQNSKIPIKKDENRSLFSKILSIGMIVLLIGIFLIGVHLLQKSSKTDEESVSNALQSVKITGIKGTNVVMPHDAYFSKLENGKIEVNGMLYTPSFDSKGNLVSYTDEAGEKYYVLYDENGVGTITLPQTIVNVNGSNIDIRFTKNDCYIKYEILDKGQIKIAGTIYTPEYDDNGTIIAYLDEQGNRYIVEYDETGKGVVYFPKVIIDSSSIQVNASEGMEFEQMDNGKVKIEGEIYTPIIDSNGKIIAYTDMQGNKFIVEYDKNDNIGKITFTEESLKNTSISVKIPDDMTCIQLDDGKVHINGITYTPVIENGVIIGYTDSSGNQYSVEYVNVEKNNVITFSDVMVSKTTIEKVTQVKLPSKGDSIQNIEFPTSIDTSIGIDIPNVEIPTKIDTSIDINLPNIGGDISIEKPTNIELPTINVKD